MAIEKFLFIDPITRDLSETEREVVIIDELGRYPAFDGSLITNIVGAGGNTFTDGLNVNTADNTKNLNISRFGTTEQELSIGILDSSVEMYYTNDESSGRFVWTINSTDTEINAGVGASTRSLILDSNSIDLSLSLGDGTYDGYFKSVHSDGTFTELHGFGLESSRPTVYVRPTTDVTQELRLGNNPTTRRWSIIKQYVTDVDSVTINDNIVYNAGNFIAGIDYQVAGTYNTVIGTNATLDGSSGAVIVSSINFTDGVATDHFTRTLTAADISAAADNHTHPIIDIIDFDPADYLGLTAKAADSDLLDGINSTSFLRSDASDIKSDNTQFYGTDITGVYTSAPIEIRDVNLVGIAESTDVYAPALTFHWGGRRQAQLALHSDGVLHLRDGNIHTDYEDMRMRTLYLGETENIIDTDIADFKTAFSWGDHAGTYVDLTTPQSIAGVKTFTNQASFTNGISIANPITSTVLTNEAILQWDSSGYMEKLTDQNGLLIACDSSMILHAGDNGQTLKTDLNILPTTTSEIIHIIADSNVSIRSNRQIDFASTHEWLFNSAGIMSTAGDIIVGNNSNNRVLTRHIDGKGVTDNTDDILYLNHSNGFDVRINGNLTYHAGNFIAGVDYPTINHNHDADYANLNGNINEIFAADKITLTDNELADASISGDIVYDSNDSNTLTTLGSFNNTDPIGLYVHDGVDIRRIWTTDNFSDTNVANWESAFSWGDHALGGYQSAGNYLLDTTDILTGVLTVGNQNTVTPLVLSRLTSGSNLNIEFTHVNATRYLGIDNTGDLLFGSGAALGSSGDLIYHAGNFTAGVDYLEITGVAADSNLLDGINSTSFLRSDVDDTCTGVITHTSSVHFDNADSIFFENSKHAITYNDGQGNFNIRVAHIATDLERHTEAGYAQHMEWSLSTGSLQFNFSDASGAISDQITWTKVLELLPDGSGSFSGQVNAIGGNSSDWNTAFGWGNHSGLYSLLAHNHDADYSLLAHNHNADYLGLTAKAADSDLLDGINSTSFARSDADDTITGAWDFSHTSNGIGTNCGIDGRYSLTGGNSNWAATIWALDSTFNGTTSGTTWLPTSLYGAAWVRSTNTEAVASVGEGLYIYQNGLYQGGIGTSGIDTIGNITVSGTVDGRDIAADGITLDGLSTNVFLASDGSTTQNHPQGGELRFTGDSAITVTRLDIGVSESQFAITLDGLVDADTLDGLDSTSFTRSDADDTITGIITHDAQLRINIGSAATPGLAFDGDSNTGIYQSAANANDLLFTCAGSLSLSMNTIGIALEPTDRLTLNGLGGNTYLYEVSNGNIEFVTNANVSCGMDTTGIGLPQGNRLYFDGSNADGDDFIRGSSAGQIDIGVGGATRLFSTASVVQANVELRSTADIVAFASDKRLKNITEVLDDEQSAIDLLTWDTFKYTFNDKGVEVGLSNKETVHIGVSAQDIQTTDPEFIRPAPFDTDINGESISGENYLTVQYEKLTVKLASALKYQIKETEKLKLQNIKQQEQIDQILLKLSGL